MSLKDERQSQCVTAVVIICKTQVGSAKMRDIEDLETVVRERRCAYTLRPGDVIKRR